MKPSPRKHDRVQDNILSTQLVLVITNPNVTEDKDVNIRDPTY